MHRMYQTHHIRKIEELSGRLWNFEIQGQGISRREKVFVPSCWETMPGLGNYRGKAEYSCQFAANGNVRLEFKGVSHTAQVYVDDVLVKEHYGAYTPFDVVLEGLQEGIHTLKVTVSNQFGEHSALHIPNDYMTYGGITRPVILEKIANAYIKWAHYTPIRTPEGWLLHTEVCVHELQKSPAYSVQICVANKTFALEKKAASDGEVKYCSLLSVDDVKMWSLQEPHLYQVTAQLMDHDVILDDLIDRVGFRTIQVEGEHILLNGRPVRIKGVCRHEDYSGFGCAIPPAAIQRDLQLIHALGCNSIRTTHYPNDEIFLDLCDEQGILVWEENHSRGLSEADMRNPNFDWQCSQCIEEMVQAHYNHPSIYIWGILNECASHTEYGRNCYEKQLQQLHRLDSSRPLTFATCQFTHDENGKQLQFKDICLDLPDVVSINIYPQWYFDTDVRHFLGDLHHCVDETKGKGKPMIISEIGAGGEYGYHSAEHLKWSEEYQAAALEEQLGAVLEDPHCCGVYIWQYCDTRVSNEWFARRPRTFNNKGLVDTWRRPKLAFETVRHIFQESPDYFEHEV